MYIRQLRILNFRGIEELTLDFRKGLNVLIGENNTGKTAVVDALRLCLGIGAERRDLYIKPEDFHLNREQEAADHIEFHLTFSGLSDGQPGIFYEMLSQHPDHGDELQLHLRFTYDKEKDRVKREYWGGETEGQQIPYEVMELLHHVHLDALRDASRDLGPGRRNQLSQLLHKIVPDEAKRDELTEEINEKVRASENWREILKTGAETINKNLEDITIRGRKHEVALDYVDTAFRRIVEGLQVSLKIEGQFAQAEAETEPEPNGAADVEDVGDNAGHPEPGADEGGAEEEGRAIGGLRLGQTGLGYNNLIYAATVIGDLEKRLVRQPESYVALLIEEPEAHLHPQLQNVFFSFLQKMEDMRTQVFVTSHSPTVTAKTGIESLSVLVEDEYQIRLLLPRDLGLGDKHRKYLERFLDVTKSQFFFSKGVILVEGISEALLLPEFARCLGHEFDLERNGIEIVNVGGVAFEPFARFFNSTESTKRIAHRCAVLSDDDASLEDEIGEQPNPGDRAKKLEELAGGNLRVNLSRITFEYELYVANEALVREVYAGLHPQTDLDFDGDLESRAKKFVEMVTKNKDKALFAQSLAYQLREDGGGGGLVVPSYIGNAIKWVVKGDE